ncbi:MAG: PD-(D/E)XK nuclease family protein, partial [Proteobacteria bacterium]|nr:PD-(D/E)XK nuclease family protein [Pseudomonadota bacterium]
WARGEADRVLRPSPLLGGMADGNGMADGVPPSPADHRIGGALESFEDGQAPPLAAGETIRGGAKLLQAQAICPAWAFYRYRLGAKALETPVDGLDARARGNLLHAVLERFWQGRAGSDLLAMSGSERDTSVSLAVDAALAEFNATLEEPLAPRLIALERERLIRLVHEWLALEATRSAAFRVVAQEREAQVDIEGIAVRLRVDRIDELDDGRRVIIDYKTGGQVSPASLATWATERIEEPQLPIYAAFLPTPAYEGVTAAEGIAGVVFARVRLDECAFVGIAADGDLLPKVSGLAEARKLFPEAQFPDWESLIGHWRTRIAAIAREIREGYAAVTFADEKALAYCEVKPLLRLPEVRAQREQSEQSEQSAHTQAAEGEA